MTDVASGTVLQVILTHEKAGTERHVAELSRALARHGWRAHIAALSSAEPRLLEEYASVANLHLLPVHPAVFLAPTVARIARTVDARVVHGHYGNATFLALAAARATGARAVTTLHLLELAHARRRSARVQGAIYRRMMRQVDAVIAISAAVRNRAVADGLCASNKIHVVQNGVGSSASGAPSQPRGDHALYVGRLAPEKRVDHAIRAVAAVAGARLVIAGRGAAEESLRALARDLMPGRCEFLGFVENPSVLMAVARVLLIPSLEEPFGLVAIEAMAQECPVIGFDSGGLPEIVLNGVTGVLVRAANDGGLGAAVSKLLRDEETASLMGRAARVRYLELFTADQMASGTAAVYCALSTNGR